MCLIFEQTDNNDSISGYCHVSPTLVVNSAVCNILCNVLLLLILERQV